MLSPISFAMRVFIEPLLQLSADFHATFADRRDPFLSAEVLDRFPKCLVQRIPFAIFASAVMHLLQIGKRVEQLRIRWRLTDFILRRVALILNEHNRAHAARRIANVIEPIWQRLVAEPHAAILVFDDRFRFRSPHDHEHCSRLEEQ